MKRNTFYCKTKKPEAKVLTLPRVSSAKITPQITSGNIRNFIQDAENLSIADFDEFVRVFLKSRVDKGQALKELDEQIGLLSNFVLLISMHYKGKYLLNTDDNEDSEKINGYSTKQEIATEFKVSKRTVNNWINDGLQETEVGGVLRISRKAMEEFIALSRTKRFAWKSVANPSIKRAS